MPQVHIIMPQLGESIAEARIVQFLVQPGDNVTLQVTMTDGSTDTVTIAITS